MSATHDIGDSVELTYTLRDDAGVLTNATVTFTLTAPGQAPAVSTPSNISTGIYQVVIPATSPGLWIGTFDATGAVTDSETRRFYVEQAPAADVYCTLAELKQRLGIPQTDTQDDGELEQAIASASRGIDKICGRRFYKDTAPTARVYYPDTHCRVKVDDFHTTTGLIITVDGTTWTAADYQLEPLNGVVDGEPGWPYHTIRAIGGTRFYTWGPYVAAPISVTAAWGWATVPERVRDACKILAAEGFKLREAPFGVAGMSDLGIIRIRQSGPAMERLAPYMATSVMVA